MYGALFVSWVEWGAPTAGHISNPDAPGYIMKFQAGNWIDLATLRESAWWRYKPRPVKIAAIAFVVYLVGRAGVEPATNGLKVRCSTT